MLPLILLVISLTLVALGHPVADETISATDLSLAADINQQKFMLYTPSNKNVPYELKNDDVQNLQNSPFNPSIPTKLIIHGWLGSYKGDSVQLLKDAYLAFKAVNVLCCDYEKYHAPYVYAVSQAQNIGNNIGKVISFLINKGGLKAEDIHIIGHSLGAHVAGYAAQYISPYQVARVTGLDPAQPLFSNNDAAHRLSSDDGRRVYVIHTSNNFGLPEPCGTIDMYPNGGTRQSNCTNGICDHNISFKYFAQSIENQNAFPALTCGSLAEAQSTSRALGSCTDNGAVMGDDDTRTPDGIYYVSVKATTL